MRYLIGSIITLFLFVGCTQTTEHLERQMNQTEEQIKFSTVKNETSIDQSPANKAKEIVASLEETTEVFAVNSKEKILLAFDVKQINRFELEQIKQNVEKILEQEIQIDDIEISTDEKIRLELEKLENTLDKKKMSNDSLEKKIKELISLSKEQT